MDTLSQLFLKPENSYIEYLRTGWREFHQVYLSSSGFSNLCLIKNSIKQIQFSFRKLFYHTREAVMYTGKPGCKLLRKQRTNKLVVCDCYLTTARFLSKGLSSLHSSNLILIPCFWNQKLFFFFPIKKDWHHRSSLTDHVKK